MCIKSKDLINACSSERLINNTLIKHQRKKGTLGITGLFGYRVPIDIQVWHLDVGSSRPLAEEG